MKKILMTGSSGFIGRNVLPLLSPHYDITAPSRSELDITRKQQVDAYLRKNHFDILLHLAAPTSGNPVDNAENRFDTMVRSFLHFEAHAKEFEKILYIGSGAEYDKSYDIKLVKEEAIGKTIPEDQYGFAKYIMNNIAQKSVNIYNVRLFGCYGPTDAKAKFIRHAIDCCLNGEAITIRQDCYFDYLYVEDLAKIMKWFIENMPKQHDYNAASGKPVLLSEIAKIVAQKMGNDKGIKILKEGFNKEYTANNERLLAEIGDFNFTSLSDGIDRQIEWQRESE